jgi:hypothetical protein
MFLDWYCKDLVGSRELDLKLSQMLHTREVNFEVSLLYKWKFCRRFLVLIPQEVFAPLSLRIAISRHPVLNNCFDRHAGHRCSKSALHPQREDVKLSPLFSPDFTSFLITIQYRTIFDSLPSKTKASYCIIALCPETKLVPRTPHPTLLIMTADPKPLRIVVGGDDGSFTIFHSIPVPS